MSFGISGADGSYQLSSRDSLKEQEYIKKEEKAEEFKKKLKEAGGKNINDIETKEEKKARNKELKEASKEFEAFFLQQMLNSMRDTVIRSDLFGDSREREIYEEMLDEALSEEASEAGGIGLADMIYEEHKIEIDEE